MNHRPASLRGRFPYVPRGSRACPAATGEPEPCARSPKAAQTSPRRLPHSGAWPGREPRYGSPRRTPARASPPPVPYRRRAPKGSVPCLGVLCVCVCGWGGETNGNGGGHTSELHIWQPCAPKGEGRGQRHDLMQPSAQLPKRWARGACVLRQSSRREGGQEKKSRNKRLWLAGRTGPPPGSPGVGL